MVAGVSVCLVAALWLAQRRLIYLPERDLTATPSEAMVATVETTDGITHRVWVVPAAGRAMARVVVFNGNAGNMSHRVALARSLAAERMEVPSRLSGLRRHRWKTERGGASPRCRGGGHPRLRRNAAGGISVSHSAPGWRRHWPAGPCLMPWSCVPVHLPGRCGERPLPTRANGLVARSLPGRGDSEDTGDAPPGRARHRRLDRPARAEPTGVRGGPGPKTLVEMEGLDHNDPGLSSGPDLARGGHCRAGNGRTQPLRMSGNGTLQVRSSRQQIRHSLYRIARRDQHPGDAASMSARVVANSVGGAGWTRPVVGRLGARLVFGGPQGTGFDAPG